MLPSSAELLKEQFQGGHAEDRDPTYKVDGLSYLIEADTTADWARQIDDVMSGVHIMTNAVKVFAIILAVIVLYNLALLNFRERTRDIATLKVLGFTKAEIASSLALGDDEFDRARRDLGHATWAIPSYWPSSNSTRSSSSNTNITSIF
jgi:hypothetical protein